MPARSASNSPGRDVMDRDSRRSHRDVNMDPNEDTPAMKKALETAFTVEFKYKLYPKHGSKDLYHFEVQLNREKAAFILGKNGKTMVKIGKVAGCTLHLSDKNSILSGVGPNQCARRCLKYLKCLTQQREGAVIISENLGDGDLTILDIPQDAVGFVTGKSGNFLRQIEEEWKVLMFFADHENDQGLKGNREYEKLAIFGSKFDRRGAELKVCSAVEAKMPGFFAANENAILDRDVVEGVDWETSILQFKNDELSFALGKRGATRRKLELASDGCIVQYVNDVAIFTGTAAQRDRIKEYIRWLFDQLEGPVDVPNWENRSDITVVEVPQEVVGYVTGAKRTTLSSVETEYGVMMFFMGSKNTTNTVEKLAIFGPERSRLGAEYRIKWSVELKCAGYYSRNFTENKNQWEKEGLSTDIMQLDPDHIGYVLGKSGVTRQKLGIAANVHLQYVGNYACVIGEKAERSHCRDYIGWLLDQRNGKIEVDITHRNDCIAIPVPEKCVGWVAGPGGRELRKIEELTRTFCFLACHPSELCERLLICGFEEGWQGGYEGRSGAAKMVHQLIEEKQQKDREGGGDSWGSSNTYSSWSDNAPSNTYNSYNSQPTNNYSSYGKGGKNSYDNNRGNSYGGKGGKNNDSYGNNDRNNGGYGGNSSYGNKDNNTSSGGYNDRNSPRSYNNNSSSYGQNSNRDNDRRRDRSRDGNRSPRNNGGNSSYGNNNNSYNNNDKSGGNDRYNNNDRDNGRRDDRKDDRRDDRRDDRKDDRRDDRGDRRRKDSRRR